MLLTELIVSNIGPFAVPTRIRFDERVTVLTGGNDCGKTSILTAIELVCGVIGSGRVLEESQVNLDRIGEAPTNWMQDKAIECKATFATTEYSDPHLKGTLEPNGEITVTCPLAPNVCRVVDLRFRGAKGVGGWSQGGGVGIVSFPRVISLPFPDHIRTVVDLKNPNATELNFLRAAFGPQFKHEKYTTLTGASFSVMISKAVGDINEKLKQFLPPSVKLRFDFQAIGEDRSKISILLRDGYEGHSPIGVRGAGVGRLVSLMAALLSSKLHEGHYIILIDEPETSLHADVQHTLRAVLESLGDRPNIQIVYATHSPAMINPVRTSAIRLIQRANDGEVATSTVDDRPVDENFLRIRSSLGLTPADSLIYAPVTLIVEGPSEVIGLPIILERLWKGDVEGFGDVGELLSQVHFLDGCGDSFDLLCKVAISNGTKPVVFLDGDKAGSRLNKITKQCPNVPIVLLEGQSEFEEIVTREVFFEALRTVMAEFSSDVSALTEANFEEWQGTKKLPEKLAFSKRVDQWVHATICLGIEKPLVMKKALQDTPLDSLENTKLLELVGRIREQLS